VSFLSTERTDSITIVSFLSFLKFIWVQYWASLDIVSRLSTVRTNTSSIGTLSRFLWVNRRACSGIVAQNSTSTANASSIVSRFFFTPRTPCCPFRIHFLTGLDIVAFFSTTCTHAGTTIFQSRHTAFCGFWIHIGTRSYIVSRLATRGAHTAPSNHMSSSTIRFMMVLI